MASSTINTPTITNVIGNVGTINNNNNTNIHTNDKQQKQKEKHKQSNNEQTPPNYTHSDSLNQEKQQINNSNVNDEKKNNVSKETLLQKNEENNSVGPIPPHLTTEEIHKHFEKHGFIGTIKLISDGGYSNIGKATFEILDSNCHLIDRVPGFGLKQLYFLQKVQPKYKCCYICRAIGHTSHDCNYKNTSKIQIPKHCLLCGDVHDLNGICKNKKINDISFLDVEIVLDAP
jgi:hypothetical protein